MFQVIHVCLTFPVGIWKSKVSDHFGTSSQDSRCGPQLLQPTTFLRCPPHLRLNSPQCLCLSKGKSKIYQNRIQHHLNTCCIQSFLMIQNNLVDYRENRTEVCFISFISAVAVIPDLQSCVISYWEHLKIEYLQGTSYQSTLCLQCNCEVKSGSHPYKHTFDKLRVLYNCFY